MTKGVERIEIKTGKFKNFKLGVYLRLPLRREDATGDILLARVLKAGCGKYSGLTEINRRLDSLYGASLSSFARKNVDEMVFSFEIDAINDAFLPEAGAAEGALSLLRDIIFDPFLDGGVFESSRLSREARAVRNDIDGIINDKRQYAMLRLLEITGKNEPFGVRECGYAEDLDRFDGAVLYDRYKKVLKEARINIAAAGNFDGELVGSFIDGLEADFGGRDAEYTASPAFSGSGGNETGDFECVREEMDVSQGKLAMAFSSGIEATGSLRFPFMVYNSVFGGGAHSKLFNNVREKLSLCYYAASRSVRANGLVLVQAGIEPANYQRALDEILLQAEEIKRGNVTSAEMTAAKAYLVSAILSYKDDVSPLLSWYESQAPFGERLTPEEAAERTAAVDLAEVVEAAQKVKLETVYFLSGKDA